jgi:hypothetical protein
MTLADGKLDPVIGREEEMRRTIEILSRRTKVCVVRCGSDDLRTNRLLARCSSEQPVFDR